MPIVTVLGLAGPDFIVIALIIAVLAAPALLAIPIVWYVSRRRKKPPGFERADRRLRTKP
jgi:hypothetical protein